MESLELLASLDKMLSMNWDEQQALLEGAVNNTNFLELRVSNLKGDVQYSDGEMDQLGDSRLH